MLGLSLSVRASGAAPVLLLLLPIKEAENITADDVPKTGFFVWRVAVGAAAGMLLLFAMTFSSTYETLDGYISWGERLRLLPSVGGRGGLLESFLTLCQLSLLLLHGAIMLLAGEQAAVLAFPALSLLRFSLFLLLIIAAAALVLTILFGYDAVLAAGALAAIPAAITLLWRGKQR